LDHLSLMKTHDAALPNDSPQMFSTRGFFPSLNAGQATLFYKFSPDIPKAATSRCGAAARGCLAVNLARVMLKIS
jgi:hypothetical protein